ncbi:unnamed protein product [Adineta ricciae]|uniref:Uncharacterized protein n=1 Tax=Adineta ricciae TaxID=249248 RepID=A0A814LD45_ADIRI|nr:unnamed protein product [Adineta ricciae]
MFKFINRRYLCAVADEPLSSCTTSLSVLKSDLYLSNVGTCTFFAIDTFNVRTIRAHSHFQVVDEILFLLDTHFKIKSQPFTCAKNDCYTVCLNHHLKGAQLCSSDDSTNVILSSRNKIPLSEMIIATTTIVDVEFQNYIDQLSILFQATAEEMIIWDATSTDHSNIVNRVNLYQLEDYQDIYETGEPVMKFNTDVHNMNLSTMIMRLGKYNGPIKCETSDGRDLTNEFGESLDELYIFSCELT